MNGPPHCAIHVSREMELKQMAAPAWLAKPEGAEDDGFDRTGGAYRKRYIRKFWKCPVEGCSRVAAYMPTEEEEKSMAARECPRCGEPSDATENQRMAGQNVCKACINKRLARKREMEEARVLHARRQKRDDVGAETFSPNAAA